MRTGRKYLMQKANINSLNFFFFFFIGAGGCKSNYFNRNKEETRNRNMEDTNHMKMLLEAKQTTYYNSLE